MAPVSEWPVVLLGPAEWEVLEEELDVDPEELRTVPFEEVVIEELNLDAEKLVTAAFEEVVVEELDLDPEELAAGVFEEVIVEVAGGLDSELEV